MCVRTYCDSVTETCSVAGLLLQLCRECFYEVFEEEIHQTIVSNKLFKPGEKVAIGASGLHFMPSDLGGHPNSLLSAV